jgi:DNA-binding NarL/FixJ family response regulator
MAAKSDQYIFLVDDEPIQNEMLKDFLSEKFDFKIKTYDSGESAMKDVHLRPQVMVLDYHLNSHLPDAKNGIEVLKMFKETLPDVKVIMLSGQDKIEVAIDSIKYGAFDYVIKSGEPKSVDAESKNWEIPLTVTATTNKKHIVCIFSPLAEAPPWCALFL